MERLTLLGVMFMQKITVITADIIGSRKAGLNQDALAHSLQGLVRPNLLIPFTISRGDEVQGVMAGWLSAPQLVRSLRWLCKPHKLRIGIGIGYHEGRLGADPWKMNGPAFFRARQALESIAAGKEPATRVVTGEEGLDTLINTAWLLLDTITNRWTPGQWEAVMTYEQAGTLPLLQRSWGWPPRMCRNGARLPIGTRSARPSWACPNWRPCSCTPIGVRN